MPSPGSSRAAPKLHPPRDARRLPSNLSLAWACALMADHDGRAPIPTLTPIWLSDALNAHAGEILPLIVGDVALDDDLLRFTVRLRRLERTGDELAEREVDVPFAYDRRSGQWSDGGLASGRGVLDFLLWRLDAVLGCPVADRAAARHALSQRLLLWLGVSAIETHFARRTPQQPVEQAAQSSARGVKRSRGHAQ